MIKHALQQLCYKSVGQSTLLLKAPAKEVANKYSAIYNVYHDIFLTSRMTFLYPTAEREVFDNYQGSVNLQ